jgi:hypothetical protein
VTDNVVLTTVIVRGSGARDQDKHRIKVKGRDVEEAYERLQDAKQKLIDDAEEWRAIQPVADQDGRRVPADDQSTLGGAEA